MGKTLGNGLLAAVKTVVGIAGVYYANLGARQVGVDLAKAIIKVGPEMLKPYAVAKSTWIPALFSGAFAIYEAKWLYENKDYVVEKLGLDFWHNTNEGSGDTH